MAQNPSFRNSASTNLKPESLIETVQQWLDQKGHQYSTNEPECWFMFGHAGEHANWRVVLDVCEDETTCCLLVVSIFPFSVPVGRRLAVAELLTRLNFDMIAGCFDIDFDDGEVRLKVAADVIPGQLTLQVINRLVQTNFGACDFCLGPILGVAFGGLEPSKANTEVSDTMTNFMQDTYGYSVVRQ